ncbi:CaiB/BaiF CoA transferase family protein, partial [Brevirhabdus sp.]|uniref:CaiB/BaiF CoA transferase family protein n=1 Tax=Brevirhabdus sp. TaxID=2004514 RepID=UPI0040591055
GDDFVRRHGGTQAMRDAGLGASFLSQNAGKRSVVLDLKTDAARADALRLAETADVVVENFRPGVLDRLGLGFDVLCARRPGLILASLSGFGPEGPLSGRPAYDHILQGVSGLMAMTGTEESGPMRVGLPIIDYIAGQALVSALLAALLARHAAPATSQRIEISMLDAITGLMGAYAVHHQTTGALRGLEGNRAFSDSPFSGRFDCAEGQIVITANTPAQATRLCAALGLPALADDPDAARVAQALRERLSTDSAEAWEDRLAAADVPAARLRTLAEALDHPQMRASPCWHDMEVPQLDMRVRVPGLPFRAPFAPAAGAPLPPAPAFGADTDAVLAALGPARAAPGR